MQRRIGVMMANPLYFKKQIQRKVFFVIKYLQEKFL